MIGPWGLVSLFRLYRILIDKTPHMISQFKISKHMRNEPLYITLVKTKKRKRKLDTQDVSILNYQIQDIN